MNLSLSHQKILAIIERTITSAILSGSASAADFWQLHFTNPVCYLFLIQLNGQLLEEVSSAAFSSALEKHLTSPIPKYHMDNLLGILC